MVKIMSFNGINKTNYDYNNVLNALDELERNRAAHSDKKFYICATTNGKLTAVDAEKITPQSRYTKISLGAVAEVAANAIEAIPQNSKDPHEIAKIRGIAQRMTKLADESVEKSKSKMIWAGIKGFGFGALYYFFKYHRPIVRESQEIKEKIANQLIAAVEKKLKTGEEGLSNPLKNLEKKRKEVIYVAARDYARTLSERAEKEGLDAFLNTDVSRAIKQSRAISQCNREMAEMEESIADETHLLSEEIFQNLNSIKSLVPLSQAQENAIDALSKQCEQDKIEERITSKTTLNNAEEIFLASISIQLSNSFHRILYKESKELTRLINQRNLQIASEMIDYINQVKGPENELSFKLPNLKKVLESSLKYVEQEPHAVAIAKETERVKKIGHDLLSKVERIKEILPKGREYFEQNCRIEMFRNHIESLGGRKHPKQIYFDVLKQEADTIYTRLTDLENAALKPLRDIAIEKERFIAQAVIKHTEANLEQQILERFGHREKEAVEQVSKNLKDLKPQVEQLKNNVDALIPDLIIGTECGKKVKEIQSKCETFDKRMQSRINSLQTVDITSMVNKLKEGIALSEQSEVRKLAGAKMVQQADSMEEYESALGVGTFIKSADKQTNVDILIQPNKSHPKIVPVPLQVVKDLKRSLLGNMQFWISYAPPLAWDNNEKYSETEIGNLFDQLASQYDEKYIQRALFLHNQGVWVMLSDILMSALNPNKNEGELIYATNISQIDTHDDTEAFSIKTEISFDAQGNMRSTMQALFYIENVNNPGPRCYVVATLKMRIPGTALKRAEGDPLTEEEMRHSMMQFEISPQVFATPGEANAWVKSQSESDNKYALI